MKALRDLTSGLLLAFVSCMLVLGAFSLALAQGMQPSALAVATLSLTIQIPPPNNIGTLEVTIKPISTELSFEPTATLCPVPKGWLPYTVQKGENAESIAQSIGISKQKLMESNCLLSANLPPNVIIFIPPTTPTVTQTSLIPSDTIPPIPCGPPSGWVQYIIQPGDTLHSLSTALGVTIQQLQLANCMGTSTILYAGSPFFVPFLPATRIPAATATPLPIFTDTPVIPPTQEASLTPEPTQTEVPTETPTETLTRPPKETVVPTETNILVPSDTTEAPVP